MDTTDDLESPIDLTVQLGRLQLPNPIMVASGTFGYAREMEHLVALDRLGAILPKTITPQPRLGNRPWRTIETPCGLLNSIGLDNDGLATFIEKQLPYLANLDCLIVVSIAASAITEYREMATRLGDCQGVDAIEINISCPNVSGGVDFGTNPKTCREVVAAVRKACSLPILAKLTPNVTDIRLLARAAEDGGADAISAINTVLGLAVNWKKRQPLLGNVLGGLSGPAIKPIALRCVYQVANAVSIPIVGIGGITNIDDVMEFMIAGATAIQLGTVNFYRPTVSMEILDALPAAVRALGASTIRDIVGSLQTQPTGSSL